MKQTDVQRLSRIAAIILTAVCLLTGFFTVVNGIMLVDAIAESDSYHIAARVSTIIINLSALFYALYAYRLPHGDHMRILCLIFSLCVAVKLMFRLSEGSLDTVTAVCYLGMIIGSSYMAGRLKNPMECFFLLGAVTLFILEKFVFDSLNGISPHGFYQTVSFLNSLVSWISISTAYLARYRRHKEAGAAKG